MQVFLRRTICSRSISTSEWAQEPMAKHCEAEFYKHNPERTPAAWTAIARTAKDLVAKELR